jgi:hypothetical protein
VHEIVGEGRETGNPRPSLTTNTEESIMSHPHEGAIPDTSRRVGLPGRRPFWWIISLVPVIVAAGLVLLVLKHPDGMMHTTLPFFWAFAVLPGIVGLANHVVTSVRQTPAEPVDVNDSRPNETDGPQTAAEIERQHRPKFSEALAAAILLTGVFGILAEVMTSDQHPADIGLTYAGIGAYVSTLWFMLVRLNASALSPRFLVNSALKASIAMLIGYMGSASGLIQPLTTTSLHQSLYFLIGLFLPMVLKLLKKTAMKTFGVTPTGTVDLSLGLLEGIDDGAVDVLEELGITSVQHLATIHAPEVCGRSLYPRDRVLDWIDQSILVMHTNGRINDLRGIGIRSAYSLIVIADHARHTQHSGAEPLHKEARSRLKEAAQRLGLTPEAMWLLTECIHRDPAYVLLERAYPDRHRISARASRTEQAAAVKSGAFAEAREPSLSIKRPQATT